MIIDLKIPYALDNEGRLIHIDEVILDEGYYCPLCKKRLVYREGNIKIWHFSHKGNTNCTKETILHQTAKLLVKEVILDWKHGNGNRPKIRRRCQRCRCHVIDQEMPDKVSKVLLEYKLESGCVLDIVLADDNDKLLAVIEIRSIDKLDQQRSLNLGLPMIELWVEGVIEHPLIMDPIEDKFKEIQCAVCKQLL